MIKTAFIIMAIAASAFGITIGFTQTTIPVIIDQPYSQYNDETDIFMITSSVEPVSRLFLEAGFGFKTTEVDEMESYSSDTRKAVVTAYSTSLYYAVIESGTVCLKAGASYRHSSSEIEFSIIDSSFKTVMNGFEPLVRLDFAFPGLEKVGFYTQFGVEYTKTKFTYYAPPGEEDEDLYSAEGWSTTAPPYGIAGIYYTF